MEKRYIVIDEPANGFGDVFNEMVFESEKEASAEAKYQWDHLTRSEQKNRHIYVGEVTEKDLEDYAFDDDGHINWSCYFQCDQVGFDSDKEA